MKKELIIGMAFSAAILSSCGPTTPQLGKSPINEVINAMTLEEKSTSGNRYRYGRIFRRQCCYRKN